jgi:hypothetical protein
VLLDELMNIIQNEFISEIPILGTGYSAMTTFFNVREQFFIEKTVIFLKGFENIDEDFRNKLDKAISEEKYKQDLEERLIIALDRFDEPEKATALFNFFVARINNEIDHQEFLRYLYVLDKIDFNNIESLRKFYSSREEVTCDSSLNSFAFVGLLKLLARLDVIVFGKNDFGSKFLKILDLLA